MEDTFVGARNLSRSGIHWRAPTTVLLSLTAGAVFAAGHYSFYSSLAGKPAGIAEYDVLIANVSEQQLNIGGGTPFVCECVPMSERLLKF